MGSDNSLSAEIETKMRWEELLGAIKDLKEIEQDVLIMRFVEDMPHREIARAVEKSESAVKVIQHRALKKLKINLK
ncbi:MAG: hypothetical protein A2Y84_01490 [Candidatus Colwellbacteria bacterium RBG_13_48_8]|uniref:RNA polymerase sigma-70 region 4 domain-containing protein n=1 Tax=Candidatus Colwellbacteria bacterium RBG_13_48_8 TaxID=1797685 RepID=A0A1G1YWH7_9BACT|nr:MAG: hypothetical protein A2Y84_01490 [Candidatus Colwellbacteria bacterium RBG_13_48_8]